MLIEERTPYAGTEANPRFQRHLEFAARLKQACDLHGVCPPANKGRLLWIRRELERLYDIKVSVETVRKWMSAEAKPHADRMGPLADLLNVKEGWLSLGVDVKLARDELASKNALAAGAVNVIVGLIQLDGGNVAFPDRETNVDVHAIIKGAKYDIYVALGEADTDGHYTFTMPAMTEGMIVLGLVREHDRVRVYEITPELQAAGVQKGHTVTVQTGLDAEGLNRIESFANRI